MDFDRDGIEQVLAAVAGARRAVLTEVEAKAVAAAAGLTVVPTFLARTADEAATRARAIGFPIAMKAVAPHLVHKSDSGGVRLGLATPAAVRDTFGQLSGLVGPAMADAAAGVSVQAMAPPGGWEFILGLKQDAQFGPMVLFGLGGILAEVYADVAMRLAPLTPYDVASLVDEVKGAALLRGVRGRPAVDRAVLAAAIQQVAVLAERCPELLEFDLNPVLVYPDRILVVDGRGVIAGSRVERAVSA